MCSLMLRLTSKELQWQLASYGSQLILSRKMILNNYWTWEKNQVLFILSCSCRARTSVFMEEPIWEVCLCVIEEVMWNITKIWNLNEIFAKDSSSVRQSSISRLACDKTLLMIPEISRIPCDMRHRNWTKTDFFLFFQYTWTFQMRFTYFNGTLLASCVNGGSIKSLRHFQRLSVEPEVGKSDKFVRL